MPITVLSPFSGRPVKVRDQDVGRAIRDEEGRIFYAIQRADGSGYYGSPTRKGSTKDEDRYTEMLSKTSQSAAQVKDEHAAVRPHDATGPGRKGGLGKLVVLLIILLLLAAGAYVLIGGGSLPFVNSGEQAPTAPTEPQDDALPPTGARFPMPSMPEELEPRVSPEAIALLMGGGDRPRQDSPTVNVAASPEPKTPTSPPEAIESVKRRIIESLDQARPFTRTASGLRYRIEADGNGKRATAGRFVLVHYTAAIYNPGGSSHIIDTSRGGAPLGFVLWTGQAIRGWDEGIAGMREGERRTLIIPTELAGNTGRTTAHNELPRADLLCEIELVEVRPGVSHRVDRVGAGRLAYPGDTVVMNYTASIDGQDKPFDASTNHGQPLRITIGAGEVISGLELGVTGMAEGEARTIAIPSYLAYGSRGAGSLIPPNSDLTYIVELLQVLSD